MWRAKRKHAKRKGALEFPAFSWILLIVSSFARQGAKNALISERGRSGSRKKKKDKADKGARTGPPPVSTVDGCFCRAIKTKNLLPRKVLGDFNTIRSSIN
jgi:hypothetical protein